MRRRREDQNYGDDYNDGGDDDDEDDDGDGDDDGHDGHDDDDDDDDHDYDDDDGHDGHDGHDDDDDDDYDVYDDDDVDGHGHDDDDDDDDTVQNLKTTLSSNTPNLSDMRAIENERTDTIRNDHTLTYTKSSLHQTAGLALALPLVAVIFVLFLSVCTILLWKHTRRQRESKRESLRNNNMNQELGEVKGKIQSPYPDEDSATSMNHYTDPNSGGAGKEKLKDPSPIEQAVPSLNHYTDTKGRGNEGSLAQKSNADAENQYAEVDENVRAVSRNGNGQNVKGSTNVNYIVNAHGSHGYEEATVRGTADNGGYEEATVGATQKNRENAREKDKRTKDDQGYEMTKVNHPFYHTLDPDSPSDSSYMSVSKRKQDGGYDTLNRLQNTSLTKPQRTSGYDLTERIGKGDAKVEPTNQTDSGYSAISRRSANTSEYDKLDHVRRGHGYEVDQVSRNDYNVLHSQEKD